MRYQDYVIKDGKFIGEFEKMYQLFEDPWHQTEEGYVENSISRQIVINYIKKYQIKDLVEFGCGLGKTSAFIQKNTNSKVLGIDISETSISKAKENYPDISFRVDNIKNIRDYADHEGYFFSEITWYLLEDKLLDNIFDIMTKHLKGKLFIHNLVFYRGQQKYGTEYFTNLDQFIKYCPFELLGKVEINLIQSDAIETSTIFRI